MLRHWLMPALCLGTAVPAQATTYYFQLSGPYSASFMLDSTTQVPTFENGGLVSAYDFGTVTGTFSTPDATFSTLDLAILYTTEAPPFWAFSQPSPFTRIFEIGEPGGPFIYTGDDHAMSFMLGTFRFGTVYAGQRVGERLVISDQPIPAVPEPSLWAMMIAGFGLAGMTMRRRRAALA